MTFYLVCKNEGCDFITKAEEAHAWLWLHFGAETACDDCKELDSLVLIYKLGSWAEGSREEKEDNTIHMNFNNPVSPATGDHYDMLVSQYEEMILKCAG